MGWVVKNSFLDVFPNTNTRKQQRFVKVLEWHRTINTTTSVAKFGVQVLVPSVYMCIYIYIYNMNQTTSALARRESVREARCCGVQG